LNRQYFENPRFQAYVLPVGLLLLNIILKSIFLGSQSIANDEPFTIYHAQLRLPFLISELSRYNNPPGFEILLHYWIKVFGISPASVRFLPMVISALSAVMLYFLGRKFFSLRIGLFAALLFTFSDFQIYFAHEARVYSLFTLLTLISMYSFLNLVSEKGTIRMKAVYVIANALLLYAHFFGFWIILVQLICTLFINNLRNRFWKEYLVLFGIPLILFLPYLRIFLARFVQSAGDGTWVRPPKGLTAILDLLRTFMNEAYGETLLGKPILSGITLAIMAFALFNLIRSKQLYAASKQGIIITTWFCAPLILVYSFSYVVPMLIDRYMVFITPAFFLLIALSVENLHKNAGIRQITVFGLLFLMLLTCKFDPENHRDVKGVVQKIKALKSKPNTLVYLCPEWFDLNFVYYYEPAWFKEVDNTVTKGLLRERLRGDGINPIYAMGEIDSTAIANADRIVFLDAGADFAIPGNGIKAYLQAHFKLTKMSEYPEIFKIYEFEKP